MNTRNSNVVDPPDIAEHQLGHDLCLVRNRQISRAGRHHYQAAISERQPSVIRPYRTAILDETGTRNHGLHSFRGNSIRPSHQHHPRGIVDPLRNLGDVFRRLALTHHNLWKAGSALAVEIDRRESHLRARHFSNRLRLGNIVWVGRHYDPIRL